MDDLQKQMEKAGFTMWNRVVGKTPKLRHRGNEIAQWLKDRKDIMSYVVLEDEPDDICGEKCSAIPGCDVVFVNMNNGLSHEDVEKAKLILRNENATDIEKR